MKNACYGCHQTGRNFYDFARFWTFPKPQVRNYATYDARIPTKRCAQPRGMQRTSNYERTTHTVDGSKKNISDFFLFCEFTCDENYNLGAIVIQS